MLKQKNIFEVLAGVIILLAVLAVGVNGFVVEAQGVPANANLYGWAWSSNIGWIKFKYTTGEPSYGVTLNTNSTTNIKELNGSAWSSSIGWIKFNPGAGPDGYPESGNAKNAQFSGTNIVGWARACTAMQNSDCGGALKNDIYRGGWDGWIKLGGGTMPSGWEGVRLVGNQLTGFAWGHEVLGWVKFHDLYPPDVTGCTGVCIEPSTDAILTVQILGTGRVTGNGINCRSNDQSTGCSLNLGINSGALLTSTITAQPFVEWRGDCDRFDPNNLKSDTRCIIDKMNRHRTVIAVFADGVTDGGGEQNTLTVDIEGVGTVSTDDLPPWITTTDGSRDYDEDDTVSVSFTPTAGGSYEVSGACSGIGNAATPVPCNLSMSADRAIRVEFTSPPQYCLAVSYGGGQNSMRVNYQTQNLEAAHSSTKAEVAIQDIDSDPANNVGQPLPQLNLRIKPLEDRTPTTGGAPFTTKPSSVFESVAAQNGDLARYSVNISFPSDGQPTPNKASPYAGNYQFLLNAGEGIPACVSGAPSPRVNFSYTDLREQEN